MRSVFEMPLHELRDRADTVCETCYQLLEALPLLAYQPGAEASDEDRAEASAASEQALSLVRSTFRRMGALLPGLSSMGEAGREVGRTSGAEVCPSGLTSRAPTDEQVNQLRRFLCAHPEPELGSDSAPTQREVLLRRAHDAMARREIFERVGTTMGLLLEELKRLKLEVELRAGLPWMAQDQLASN